MKFNAFRHIAFLLAALMTVLGVSAQSVSLQVSRQVIQGNRFTVSVRVSNGEGRVTKDQAPKLPGCTLLYGPATSTMHSVQIVNGRQSSSMSTDYSFTYQADKAGQVTIPAISVVVDGKKMSTQPTTITILPPDQSSQRQNQYYDPFEEMFGDQPAPQSQTRKPAISAKDFIITVNLSKQSVYEKEAVIATIKLYTKHNITRFQPKVMPQFEGFLSEELPVSQQTAQIEHFRGENYYTVVLKKCLLFPTKSGRLTINSGQYDVTLETVEYVSNGYFATPVPHEQSMTTTSNSVSINVKPLPTPAPAGFNGAVGRFDVTTDLVPERLRTNEAATYTFSLSGTGNLKYLSEPSVAFPSTVEEYTPQSENDARFDGTTFSGTYTASYTIVPQETGQIVIPGWQFAYFNPATGKYVTVQLPEYVRDVAKGLAGARSTSSVDALDTENIRDIRHIVKIDEDSLKTSSERRFMVSSLWYWMIYILLSAALLTAVFVYRRHIRSMSDVEGRRTRRARSVASKRLQKAAAAMRAHNNDAFHAAVASALWGYLSDKLRMPASLLTRDNIAEKLTEIGADSNLVAKTIAVLDDCEAARFTPDHTDSEISTLYNDASEVINAVQRIKISGKSNKPVQNVSRYGDNL